MSSTYVKVYPTEAGQMAISVASEDSPSGFVFEVKPIAEVLTLLGIPDLIAALSIDDMIPKYTLAERDALDTQPIGTLIRLIDDGANTIQSSDGAGGWV